MLLMFMHSFSHFDGVFCTTIFTVVCQYFATFHLQYPSPGRIKRLPARRQQLYPTACARLSVVSVRAEGGVHWQRQPVRHPAVLPR